MHELSVVEVLVIRMVHRSVEDAYPGASHSTDRGGCIRIQADLVGLGVHDVHPIACSNVHESLQVPAVPRVVERQVPQRRVDDHGQHRPERSTDGRMQSDGQESVDEARYILRVRDALEDDGLPLQVALGS